MDKKTWVRIILMGLAASAIVLVPQGTFGERTPEGDSSFVMEKSADVDSQQSESGQGEAQTQTNKDTGPDQSEGKDTNPKEDEGSDKGKNDANSKPAETKPTDSDTKNPDTKNPDTKNPDTKNSDAKNSDIKNSDVKDTTGNKDQKPRDAEKKAAQTKADEEATDLVTKEPEENMEELAVSRVQADQKIYAQDLKSSYHLTFDADFGEVMKEIADEYIAANAIHTKAQEDTICAANWQDIIAVYLWQEYQQGTSEFTLGKADKEGLSKLYAEMNRLVVAEEEEGVSKEVLLYQNLNTEPVQYENLHVTDYIDRDQALSKPKMTGKDRKFLELYSSNECMTLCASATGAEGFVEQSLAGAAKERREIVKAAYSLVGKIPYFWGGKSAAIGWDNRFGTVQKVTAAGSTESGSIRKFGLDCSGYVSWAFANGAYNSEVNVSDVGAGTVGQWAASKPVTQKEALPGDLVFLNRPIMGTIGHVGIVVGKSDAGDLIVAHCNASRNGVTVESAYKAGFRYIRRPNVLEGTADTVSSDR